MLTTISWSTSYICLVVEKMNYPRISLWMLPYAFTVFVIWPIMRLKDILEISSSWFWIVLYRYNKIITLTRIICEPRRHFSKLFQWTYISFRRPNPIENHVPIQTIAPESCHNKLYRPFHMHNSGLDRIRFVFKTISNYINCPLLYMNMAVLVATIHSLWITIYLLKIQATPSRWIHLILELPDWSVNNWTPIHEHMRWCSLL